MAKKKNTRTVVIAVVVALAVLAGAVGVGWIVGSGSRDDADTSTASQGASGGPEETADEEGGDSVCGLPDGSQEVPAEGPEAEWQILQGHTVPSSSEKFGPGETKGADRACFAHNPTGALFAALNIGRVLPKELVLKHMTEGEFRDALEDAPEPSVDPNSRMEVQGFKLDVKSKNIVVVRPVYSMDGGVLHEIPVRMVWQDGDWMIDGTYRTQPQDLESLDGYVEWGPK